MYNRGIFRRVLVLSSLVFFLVSGLALAEETAASSGRRPRIGLVLGGGGAKGAAHVGVLKVLEECRVPIDFIIGTSMGSIVGGFYASGLSPQEMTAIMSETDWVDLFSDKPSESYLPLRLKREDTRLMRFELGITKKGIALPRGAIGGQKLEFMLKQLTMHVADVENFDQLRLPFRAVSTDLSTGEVVVMGEGSLPKAMRASMSIPGVFPPMELDGRILVDGYVVNNVPVEVAQQMGADILIGVDVGGKMGKARTDMSLMEIMAQSSDILARQNVERSLALLTEKDLLISPVLDDVKPDSFTKTPEAVDIGEAAARQLLDKIKRYSVSESEYREYLTRQRGKPMKEIVVEFIEVEPPARVSEARVRGQLKTRVGEPLDPVRLQNDLTRIYALGDFETVDFKIAKKDGKEGVVISTKAKDWGPNYLRFGMNFSSDSQGDSYYGLLTEFRMTQLTKLGTEWRTVMEFGSDQAILSELYAPLDIRNFFFVDPYFKAQRRFTDAYDGDTRVAEYEAKEVGGGLDVGVNFSSLAEGRVGIVQRVIDASPSTGNDPDLPEYDSHRNAGLRGRLVYDQLDNHGFPKNGIVSELDFFSGIEELGSDDSYNKLEFNISKAKTYGGKHTFIGSLAGGTVFNEDAPYFDQNKLGGFLHLSGYADDQLRGQHSALGRLIYYYKVGSIGPSEVLRNGIYVGAAFEAGNAWEDSGDVSIDDLLLGGTVFLGFESFFGPIYAGYGQTEGSEEGRFYVFMGKVF